MVYQLIDKVVAVTKKIKRYHVHAFFEVFIALRYLRAKRRNSFISFISVFSMIGIALGVLTLITVLSVMNGFQKEIQAKTLSILPNLEVMGPGRRLDSWPLVANALQNVPHVKAVTPVVTSQTIITVNGSMRPASLQGVDPASERNVVDVDRYMVQGTLSALAPGEFGIILGDAAAAQLDVHVGDKVSAFSSEGDFTPVGMMPRSKRFTVVGLFHVGMYDVDSGIALINLQDAQRFLHLDGAVTSVQAKLDDPLLAPDIKAALQSRMPDLLVQDWTDSRADYFAAVHMEKQMMSLVLGLIIVIATFNLVSTLVMVVTEKQASIAILRTLGASPASVMGLFLVQGTVSGAIGTVLGILVGVPLALHAQAVAAFLTGHSMFSKSVYILDHLPSDVRVGDVTTIALISLALAFVATLYPSWRAARTQPVEALRYE
jgi:lipoprotein-releasing system permease protein